jgi:gliding motility-associated-like protein
MYCFVTFFLIGIFTANTQSFSKRLPSAYEIPLLVQQVATLANGNCSVLFSGGNPNSIDYAPVYLCNLDENGNVSSSLSVRSTNDTLGWRWIVDYQRLEGLHVFNAIGNLTLPVTNYVTNKSGFFVIDNSENTAWAKKASGAIGVFKSAISNNNVLTTRSMQSNGFPTLDRLGISCFQKADGVPVWEYDYYSPDVAINRFESFSLATASNGEIVFAGKAETLGSSFYFVVTFSEDGTPLHSIRLPENYKITSALYDEQNNLYLSGEYSGGGVSSGFVAKLTNDLLPIWGNELYSDQYGYNQINLFPSPNNQVTFVSTDADDVPVISGIFTPTGELVRFQGYATQFADFAKVRDGGLIALSPFSFENGEIASIPFVFKANEEGIIEGCEAYNSCVTISPLKLTATSLEWVREVAFPLPDIELTIQPITLQTSDYCGSPPPPTPDFLLEDTICQNSCLSPYALNNQFANHVQWQIIGPDVDTLIEYTTFQWCFPTPGSYVIEHQIWTLGCFANFTDTVTVLPDNLQPPLGPDTIACTFPYPLFANSSRPLTSFLWSDGSTNATLNIPTAGTYQVTASDGYCEVIDTITITDIEALYPPPLVQVVTDTTICQEAFPFSLQPQSPYTTEFFLDATPFRDSIDLPQAGTYLLRWTLNNCEFQEPIQLATRNCSPNIYLPNIFSPNQDGINDRVYPQGINFLTVQLQVFDRWGGLVHSVSGSDSHWDGTRQGKPAGNGTYLIVLHYRNVNFGGEGVVTQEVTLLR